MSDGFETCFLQRKEKLAVRKLIIYTNQTILRPAAVIVATLALVMGTNPARADGVNATVNFSPTDTGLPLNPAFVGLSYEKLAITNNSFFASNNLALVKLFSQEQSSFVGAVQNFI